jgi:isorenieratene synthase
MTRTPLFRRSEPGLRLFGSALPEATRLDTRPDWQQASPAWIKRALALAQALPTGGWYALDASAAIAHEPRCYTLRGRPLVVWRDARGIVAAPEACPHLGASLAGACVRQGKLICPWHGLALGREGHAGWKPLCTHDDGVLFWVRCDDEPGLTAAPLLPLRPAQPLDAVIRIEAACEPRDVIANRLDPWHGAHFHPHSFGSLHVIDQRADEITVRVAFKVLGPLAVEVDARFHCVDARTIVMTIVRGEGAGSVVETHATPLQPGRTAIVEATLATSSRAGFRTARALARWLRPVMGWAARRLWIEDAAYAERLYALRTPRAAVTADAPAGESKRRSPSDPFARSDEPSRTALACLTASRRPT